jgi:thioredoxin-like negative regulator of GroEL
VSFWRKEVIQPALDAETVLHINEQRNWIEREPRNPKPHLNLAQLYRMDGREEEALGLLLQAVHLDAKFAPARVALVELYAVRGDYKAAWRHARAAQELGEPSAVALLLRHSVPE